MGERGVGEIFRENMKNIKSEVVVESAQNKTSPLLRKKGDSSLKNK